MQEGFDSPLTYSSKPNKMKDVFFDYYQEVVRGSVIDTLDDTSFNYEGWIDSDLEDIFKSLDKVIRRNYDRIMLETKGSYFIPVRQGINDWIYPFDTISYNGLLYPIKEFNGYKFSVDELEIAMFPLVTEEEEGIDSSVCYYYTIEEFLSKTSEEMYNEFNLID